MQYQQKKDTNMNNVSKETLQRLRKKIDNANTLKDWETWKAWGKVLYQYEQGNSISYLESMVTTYNNYIDCNPEGLHVEGIKKRKRIYLEGIKIITNG